MRNINVSDGQEPLEDGITESGATKSASLLDRGKVGAMIKSLLATVFQVRGRDEGENDDGLDESGLPKVFRLLEAKGLELDDLDEIIDGLFREVGTEEVLLERVKLVLGELFVYLGVETESAGLMVAGLDEELTGILKEKILRKLPYDVEDYHVECGGAYRRLNYRAELNLARGTIKKTLLAKRREELDTPKKEFCCEFSSDYRGENLLSFLRRSAEDFGLQLDFRVSPGDCTGRHQKVCLATEEIYLDEEGARLFFRSICEIYDLRFEGIENGVVTLCVPLCCNWGPTGRIIDSIFYRVTV